MLRFIRKENNECFIGAMAYIYYKMFGTYISEHRLKNTFKYSLKGVLVNSITKYSKDIGIESKAMKVTTSRRWIGNGLILRKIGQCNHFLAISNGMIFDPATGMVSKGNVIEGDILIILIPTDGVKPYDDILDVATSGNVVPIIIPAILATLLSIYGSYFMNDLLSNTDSLYLFLKYGLIGIVGIVLVAIQKITCQNIIAKNTKMLLERYNNKLLNSSLSISRYFSLGQIKRVASDISSFVEFETNKKPAIISSLIMIICTFTILLERTVLLAWLSILFSFVFAFIKIVFKQRQKSNFETVRQTNLKFDNSLNHYYQNIRRAISSESYSYNLIFDKDVENIIKSNIAMSKTNIGLDALLQVVTTVFSLTGPMIVFSVINKEHIPIGYGLFLVLLSSFLFNNLVNLFTFAINFEQNDIYKYKVCDFLISDSNVKTVTYDGQDEFEIKKIMKGHNQLIGPNGCGKSTMLNIMAGIEGGIVEDVELLSSESIVLSEVDNHKMMSQGERQILNAALLLQKNPEYVILDEAFNSVEIKLRQEIYLQILEKFENVLIVDHQLILNINNIIV